MDLDTAAIFVTDAQEKGVDRWRFRNTPISTTPTYPPAEDAMTYASQLSGAPSPFLNPEMLGMLPLPESPVLASNFSHPRHRHTPSMSSGPHSPSPLAQAPLVSSPERKDKHAKPS